jgi:hypothetical protein
MKLEDGWNLARDENFGSLKLDESLLRRLAFV